MKKKFLAVFAGLLLLAGCGGAQARVSTPGELVINGDYVIPPTAHGNPFIGGYVGGGLDPYLNDGLFAFTPNGDEHFKSHLATDYTSAGAQLTINLKDNILWSNGEKITANDVATSYYMWVGKKQVWEYLEGINVPNENTVEFNFRIESPLMMNLLSDVKIQGVASEYGKWADQYKEIAATGREWHPETNTFWFSEDANNKLEALNQDLDAYKPEVTAMVGSGPFTVEALTTDQANLVANTHFYTETGIDKMTIVRATTPEVAANAMIDGTLDIQSGGMNADLLQQVEKKVDGYTEFFLPEYSQMSIVFNTQKEFSSNKEFRKAMAYLLNKEELLPLAEVGSMPSENSLSGLPVSLQKVQDVETWAESNLTQYTYNEELAAETLENAGWQKDATGSWLDETGKKVVFELSANNGWGSALLPGEAYVDMLSNFGFDVAFKPMESAAYDAYLRNGEHSVAIEFAPPSNILYANAYGTYEQLYKGRVWLFGMATDENGRLELENAQGQKVDVIELTNKLFSATGEEYDNTLKELMEVTAENALFIPYLEKGFPVRILKTNIDFGVTPEALIQDPRFSGVAEQMFATLIIEGSMKDAIKE